MKSIHWLSIGRICPKSLAEASVIAEEFGYKEINLNVGCPSTKCKRKIWCCINEGTRLVSECINEMYKSVNVPITVKCRIGVDDMDKESESIDLLKRQVFGCNTNIHEKHG